MPPFRDDHILIIAPGSVHTFAQLGLPESFTPPKVRIQSRMFPGIEEGTWTATKIREAHEGEKDALIAAAATAAAAGQTLETGSTHDATGQTQTSMQIDTQTSNTQTQMQTQTQTQTPTPGPAEEDDDEGDDDDDGDEDEDMKEDGVYVEDEDDEEGAVWCIREGKVVNWGAFFALLQYVHETINPTFHTPILLVHPPSFTGDDKEKLTQFIFEKLKAPGFALLDASLSALWAYGLSTATVIDVGHERTDVTPIVDFMIQDRARRTVYKCGGETMTQHLHSLLPDLKLEDVEQLKKSPVCEVLPLGTPLPGEGGTPRATSEAVSSEDKDTDMMGEDEGTINVAAIVASGKTQEFLARKEKERRGEEERRKPNRERETNYFWVIDKKRPGEVDLPPSALSSPVVTHGPGLPVPAAAAAVPAPAAEPTPPVATTEVIAAPTAPPGAPAPAPAPITIEAGPSNFNSSSSSSTSNPTSTQTSPTTANPPAPITTETLEESEARHKAAAKRAQEKRAAAEGIVLKPDETWRELAIGTERFRAAQCGILQHISDELFHTISTVEEVGKRADLWDSIIVVGNGAKIRGFKEALLQTVTGKYLIPPSTGTIFSSELPSSLSTPAATGANTPSVGGGSGPNPLLVAATTANMPPVHNNNTTTTSSSGGGSHATHSSHGQTPMSIKYAKMPEYFPEWKEVGFDEAGFLGAQVAAKVVFVVDQGASRGFMTRVEYNEVGPAGCHYMSL